MSRLLPVSGPFPIAFCGDLFFECMSKHHSADHLSSLHQLMVARFRRRCAGDFAAEKPKMIYAQFEISAFGRDLSGRVVFERKPGF